MELGAVHWSGWASVQLCIGAAVHGDGQISRQIQISPGGCVLAEVGCWQPRAPQGHGSSQRGVDHCGERGIVFGEGCTHDPQSPAMGGEAAAGWAGLTPSPSHCQGRGKFRCDSIIADCKITLGKLAFKA